MRRDSRVPGPGGVRQAPGAPVPAAHTIKAIAETPAALFVPRASASRSAQLRRRFSLVTADGIAEFDRCAVVHQARAQSQSPEGSRPDLVARAQGIPEQIGVLFSFEHCGLVALAAFVLDLSFWALRLFLPPAMFPVPACASRLARGQSVQPAQPGFRLPCQRCGAGSRCKGESSGSRARRDGDPGLPGRPDFCRSRWSPRGRWRSRSS